MSAGRLASLLAASSQLHLPLTEATPLEMVFSAPVAHYNLCWDHRLRRRVDRSNPSASRVPSPSIPLVAHRGRAAKSLGRRRRAQLLLPKLSLPHHNRQLLLRAAQTSAVALTAMMTRATRTSNAAVSQHQNASATFPTICRSVSHPPTFIPFTRPRSHNHRLLRAGARWPRPCPTRVHTSTLTRLFPPLKCQMSPARTCHPMGSLQRKTNTSLSWSLKNSASLNKNGTSVPVAWAARPAQMWANDGTLLWARVASVSAERVNKYFHTHCDVLYDHFLQSPAVPQKALHYHSFFAHLTLLSDFFAQDFSIESLASGYVDTFPRLPRSCAYALIGLIPAYDLSCLQRFSVAALVLLRLYFYQDTTVNSSIFISN